MTARYSGTSAETFREVMRLVAGDRVTTESNGTVGRRQRTSCAGGLNVPTAPANPQRYVAGIG